MKIKFFNPNSLDRNLKATIHKSGKLGFTVDAANKMDLKPNMSAAVGKNEEDEAESTLYIKLFEQQEKDAFNVAKAGAYFYINLKALFDALKFNYKMYSYIYDITEETIEGEKYFKLTLRENVRKDKIENGLNKQIDG